MKLKKKPAGQSYVEGRWLPGIESLRRSGLFLIVLLLCLGVTISAQTKVEDIQTFTLKNGMKIIVWEDHSIPNANMYFFYKVGSRNEYPGITGISHFIEHMMFNGAKKYGPKMFDRVMEAAGGANNAFTSQDITAYTDWFPSQALETMFDLEADRIAHLALDEKMVESERGVVLSERITGMENSNVQLLMEQVQGVAIQAHPYHWSVIGYESDIKNWRLSDMKQYVKTYYAPNNTVCIICGDVTLDNVKKLTQKYFEPIPAQKPPRPVHTVEPEQLGEKRLWVKKDVSSPHLMILYHTPGSCSKEYYPLSMLSSILSEGNASRLHKKLVDEEQLAVRITTWYEDSMDPYLFSVYAICAKGVDENKLEAAIYREINNIIAEGVTEKELEKVKNRKLVDFYRTMATINGRAQTIGIYESFYGSYKKLFNAPEEYGKVTVEDIKAVAKNYLKKSNRTVGILKKSEEK